MANQYGAGIQLTLNHPGTNNQNHGNFQKTALSLSSKHLLVYTNTIAIDKATDFSSVRLSYTNYNGSGLLPNSSLKKNNVFLTGQWNITKKLTVTGTANYMKQNGKGRNATGYNGNITTNFRQWQQTNLDFKDLKTAYDLTQRNLTWNYNSSLNYPLFTNNPYWDAYQNYETDSRNRFIGNASVNYKIVNWLDAFWSYFSRFIL